MSVVACITVLLPSLDSSTSVPFRSDVIFQGSRKAGWGGALSSFRSARYGSPRKSLFIAAERRRPHHANSPSFARARTHGNNPPAESRRDAVHDRNRKTICDCSCYRSPLRIPAAGDERARLFKIKPSTLSRDCARFFRVQFNRVPFFFFLFRV